MTQKNLQYYDAVKITTPPGFSILIKPVGALCNLNCKYCYYLHKREILYKNKQSKNNVMDYSVLEEVVMQYITSTSSREVTFNWHGGEPLLAGLDFYEKAMLLQNKYAAGRAIKNTLQTNGTLINEQWAQFFAKNNFLIGISIDGPEDIHNYYRNNSIGEGSFAKVMRGIEYLRSYNVEFNTLTVITDYSESKALEIYDFLKSIGTSFMQFLPAVDFEKNYSSNNLDQDISYIPSSWSVSSLGYGLFMHEIFLEWISKDIGKIFIQLFEVVLGIYYGLTPTLCTFAQTCGDSIVVEHNGDVFSCDHFVTKDNFIGNISKETLLKMATSYKQREFGFAKRDTLPIECFSCDYFFACHGGCPIQRSPNQINSKYYLCEGQKYFLANTEPYMKKMADLLKQGKSPSEISLVI